MRNDFYPFISLDEDTLKKMDFFQRIAFLEDQALFSSDGETPYNGNGYYESRSYIMNVPFIDGKINGILTVKDKVNKNVIYKANYVDSRKNGKYYAIVEKEISVQGHFKNGYPKGFFQVNNFPNLLVEEEFKLVEGRFDQGKKVGKWVYYKNDEHQLKQIEWDYESAGARKSIYRDGRKVSEGRYIYQDGKLTEVERKYIDNGKWKYADFSKDKFEIINYDDETGDLLSKFIIYRNEIVGGSIFLNDHNEQIKFFEKEINVSLESDFDEISRVYYKVSFDKEYTLKDLIYYYYSDPFGTKPSLTFNNRMKRIHCLMDFKNHWLIIKNYFGETAGIFNLMTKKMEGFIDPERVQEYIKLKSFCSRSFSELFGQRIYSCENRSNLFLELKSINEDFDLKTPSIFWNGKSHFKDNTIILGERYLPYFTTSPYFEVIRPIELIGSKSYSNAYRPGFNYDIKNKIEEFYNSL